MQEKSPVFKKSNTGSQYCSYEPGKLNLIISVPHGGWCKPMNIPNRVSGSCAQNDRIVVHRSLKDSSVSVCIKNDAFTVQLAHLLTGALERHTGKRPHVVINHLHRIKLDCNRNISEAALGNQEAMTAWRAYHNAIITAKAAIAGRGLLLDIHGHSHKENWIELGYGIRHDKLNHGNYDPSDTSIKSLHKWHQMQSEPKGIDKLIHGQTSLGGLLENAGYTVIPSPKHPCPNDCNYFSGGFSILRHGSKLGGCIDAIQIESPLELRSVAEKRWHYADSLGKIIAEFLHIHYP